ncbi:hypothetical protein QVD17_14649 [Tagetes erecta]|uniref:Lachrymatory factor synthase n=1 Tax=Tagetes erecta TaxID=13708 RepID=A0AAD8KTD1_TARER|nr:hypothetical protein QVD17_14649 [Tagetes erecta]
MADQQTKNKKWQGKATTQLKTTPPEQIWALLQDFCNFNKWLTTLDTCHQVQGVDGVVRYCATIVDQPPTSVVKWCHEKLLEIDHVNKCLKYEIGENNMGFGCYVAEMKVVEVDGGCGCMVEWLFTADPVDGMRLEDLCGYLESSLKAMGERMEKELQAVPN